MDGDYEKAKKAAFDDNLVLKGNPKSLSNNAQTMSAYQVQQRQKEKAKKEALDGVPSDRRAYADKNEKLMFKAMPPPLKCSAASIFYKGHAARQNERAEKAL